MATVIVTQSGMDVPTIEMAIQDDIEVALQPLYNSSNTMGYVFNANYTPVVQPQVVQCVSPSPSTPWTSPATTTSGKEF